MRDHRCSREQRAARMKQLFVVSRHARTFRASNAPRSIGHRKVVRPLGHPRPQVVALIRRFFCGEASLPAFSAAARNLDMSPRMTLRFLQLVCLLLACGGCVVADDGFAPEPGSSIASSSLTPRRLCELDVACGGDVSGEWTTGDACVSISTSGRPPIPNCPAATIEGFIDDIAGGYTFQEDGNYTANLEYVGRVVVNAPFSCIPSGTSCAALEGDDSECVARGDYCECAQPFELDRRDVAGSYQTQGSEIEYSNDAPTEYCVADDSLTLRTIAEATRVGELVVEVQIELKRK